MNHYGLFVRLMQRRIPTKLLYILEQWFMTGSTWVKWGSCVSDFFDLRYGVRQGCVCLFAVYIDIVFECVSDCGVGCTIKRYFMSIFMYGWRMGWDQGSENAGPENAGPMMSSLRCKKCSTAYLEKRD